MLVHTGEGDGEGAGEDAGAVDAVEDVGEDAGGGAGDGDAYEAAGEGAGGAGVAGAGADEIAAWEANSQQLCGLLKQPLVEGREAFLKKSPEFQEWVWELLDCWEVTYGKRGAAMRETIHRLTALPAPPNVRKAHHFDGLVTWETSERTGKLAPGFQYRASSIWRRVTRDMTAESLNHSRGYTPDHIHRVVEWFCDNSISIQPDQTAEMVKTAFKKAFGCMTKGCVTHAQTALDVDHVNPAYKAETFAQLVRKDHRDGGQTFFSGAYVCRELLGTQVLCVPCHRAKNPVDRQ